MAIDSKKIIEIASKLQIESNEKGIMAAFGVYAAMNYNEFYFKVVSQAIHAMNTHSVLTIEKNYTMLSLNAATIPFTAYGLPCTGGNILRR
ncbi:MAG: hypothetical protein L6290_13780 [Thermodesulfovibrionales bacterium]|nr:hypothetical protein [Thermodesulfovibrionales bacterium]